MESKEMMRAVIHTQYGPPEVAELLQVPKPGYKANEVLIKVHATTVNRTDCGFRSAEYFISRFWSGLLKPKHKTLGCEFAGELVAVGEAVTLYKPGDKVFGYNDKTFGGHAEFLVLNEKETFTSMPANLTFGEAAALTEGSHYALGIIRAANVKAGQNVLVYGATGAIGSAAVQLLHHFGAHVTGVCHTRHLDLVKHLGAQTVVDYTQEDFTKTGQLFDFVFDAVGKVSFGQCKPVLNRKGIYISTELGKNAENVYLPLLTGLTGRQRVLFPIPSFSQEDLVFLKELAEAGKFKPVIDRQYSLDQIVEAYNYVETGQKTGNVIISVS